MPRAMSAAASEKRGRHSQATRSDSRKQFTRTLFEKRALARRFRRAAFDSLMEARSSSKLEEEEAYGEGVANDEPTQESTTADR
jgi:hypothetical protein